MLMVGQLLNIFPSILWQLNNMWHCTLNNLVIMFWYGRQNGKGKMHNSCIT
jgi:hypothetical protein